jgi:ubiquinone/menaquinone biosynthesis C-methylase UbiE
LTNLKQPESFDDIAEIYDETRSLSSEVTQEFYDKLVKKGINLENSIILDGGIGTGRTIAPLLKYNIKLIGIDNSKNMLEKLRENFKGERELEKVRLINGDVTKLPFKNNSFDLIISIQVLHLVTNWKQAIDEVKRVLKPQGFFIIAGATSQALASKVAKKYFEFSLKYDFIKNIKKKLIDILFRLSDFRFTKNIANKFLSRYYHEFYLKRVTRKLMKDSIIWTESINPYEVYERLDKRYHTDQWSIPITQHEKIMIKLKKWMNKEKNIGLSEEKINRQLNIVLAQF